MTVNLLRLLDRRRFKPTLALMRAEGEHLSAVPRDVPVIDLGAHSMWSAWWPLRKVLARQNPEVLFSTSSGANILAAVARLLVRRRPRLVLSERNVLARDQPGWKLRLVLFLKKVLYPTAQCVTVVSSGVGHDLEQRLGIEKSLIRVVYNPVVTDEIQSLSEEEVSHPWFQGSRPTILAAGRLVPAKGFPTLIRAFHRLRRNHDVRLAILGEGPKREELEELVASLGEEELVSLPGFDPNPFRYMSRCTIFVLSSRFEGLPGVLIQAMSCGAAVVSTDCPSGPSEIVDHGENGLLVPVDDDQAMAKAISTLLEQPSLRSTFGARAKEKAARFRAEASIHLYEDALSLPTTNSETITVGNTE